MESEMKRLGADFARDAVSPLWERLDARDAGLLDGILKKAASAGIMSFIVPECAGGSGMRAVDCAVFMEEVARAGGGAAFALASHFAGVAPLVVAGGDVCGKLLKRIADGEAESRAEMFAAAVREESGPGFADDTIMTTAEVAGDVCVVSGVKRGVVCGDAAVCFTVLARMGDELCWVVVPGESAGVVVREPGERIGMRFCGVGDVEFRGVEVSAENVFDVFRGFGRVLEFYSFVDPVYAAVAVGIGSCARDAALKYSLERYQGGKMICGHDTVRGLLSGMEMKLRAARSFAFGAEAGYVSSAYAAAAAEEICLDAIQVFGGYGYMKDYRMERCLRDAKALRAAVMPEARIRRLIGDEIEGLE